MLANEMKYYFEVEMQNLGAFKNGSKF